MGLKGFAAAAILAALPLGACGSPDYKKVIGSYEVMVTRNGLSDPDVLTLSKGASDSLLVDFSAGITPADGSPSPIGLRAGLSGTALTIDTQAAHVAHSTGEATGKLSAKGMLPMDGSSVQLSITFVPGDGPAMGQTLMYDVTGSKL